MLIKLKIKIISHLATTQASLHSSIMTKDNTDFAVAASGGQILCLKNCAYYYAS